MIQSIYQKLLQNDYLNLAPILQEIHGDKSNIKARGIVQIEYGNGILVKVINKLLKMPNQGTNVMTKLEVDRNANDEIWTREFNKTIFRTKQFIKNEYLIEQKGAIFLVFSLYVKDSGLEFQQEYTRFYKLKLPKILSVVTTAFIKAENESWHIHIEIKSPILGLLIKYYGTFNLVE